MPDLGNGKPLPQLGCHSGGASLEPTVGIIRQFVTIRAHFFQKTAGIERTVAFAGDREPGGEKEEHVLGSGLVLLPPSRTWTGSAHTHTYI